MPITYIESNCYTDQQGFTRLMWDDNDGNGVKNAKWSEFDVSDMTVRAAKTAEWNLQQQYGWIERVQMEIAEHDPLCISFVQWTRNHPNATLTQMTTQLNTLLWWEKAIVQYFQFKLAVALSIHYGVNLPDYTVNQVWIAVRDWLCNSNIHLVARVCFGLMEI